MTKRSKKSPQSVIGLNLSEGQLRAFAMTRAKGSVAVDKIANTALVLDLQHPEAELVGREIRNHLDAANIKDRDCVVALPEKWIMTQTTRVPELSADDLNGFLEIEAEKGFPCDLAQLQIARSFCRSGTATFVTQFAVRKENLEHLAQIMRSAGLRPVSFTLGLAALPGVAAPAGQGGVSVVIEATGAAVAISAGGGIAAVRTGDATVGSELGETVINGSAVTREVRITVEQVPAELRSELREVTLYGEEPMVTQLREALADWTKAAGFKLSVRDGNEQPVAEQIARELAVSWLEGRGNGLEFLPPRPTRWNILMARYSSKRLAAAGFAAAAVAVIVILAFGWQEYRRWSLQSRWHAMEGQVTDLQAVQARVREYRPWNDISFHDLKIIQRVTECFPDNGSVTAKSVEIQGASTVTITGTARDNTALLRTLDQLRKAKEIRALKVEQIRGQTPEQFTCSFRWDNGGST